MKAKPVCLNVSTGGVSCESAWFQSCIDSYIRGHWNILALIYPNHNVKNPRYYLIGGSCADIMGSYVFDPWLLKMAGVANELWRIQDYDSDLLVICLASKRTI